MQADGRGGGRLADAAQAHADEQPLAGDEFRDAHDWFSRRLDAREGRHHLLDDAVGAALQPAQRPETRQRDHRGLGQLGVEALHGGVGGALQARLPAAGQQRLADRRAGRVRALAQSGQQGPLVVESWSRAARLSTTAEGARPQDPLLHPL